MHNTAGGRIAAERAAAIKAAQEIVDRAKRERRELTSQEHATVKGHIDEVDKLDRERKAAEESDALMARVAGRGTGQTVEDAEEFQEQKQELVSALRSKAPRQIHVPRKALDTVGLDPVPMQGGVFGPLTPTEGAGAGVTALRELFPVEEAESPVVRYYEVSAVTGGPEIVEEGGLKPEMGSTITPRDVPVVKLAGRFITTTEFVEDAVHLMDELLRQALLALVRRENQLILDTLNATSGVLTATGTQAAALDTIAGAIGAQESLNGVGPDALVINPADLAKLRSLKSGGSGEYVLDPLAAGVPSVFGVPIMATPAMPAGTVWLLRKEAGRFYQRKAVSLTSMPSGNDFDHNRITTVVEERVLPVVVQPRLVTKVTLTA